MLSIQNPPEDYEDGLYDRSLVVEERLTSESDRKAFMKERKEREIRQNLRQNGLF